MTDHSIATDSAPQAEPGATRAFTDSARITGDTARIVIGGAPQSGAFDNVKTTTGELMPRPDGSQGILSTARSTAGRLLTGSEIRANTKVLVQGVETTAAAAAAAGFLTRNSDGSYAEVGAPVAAQGQQQSTQGQPEAQPEAQEPARVADLPAEAHTFAQDFTSRVGNIDVSRGVSEMMDQGALSEDSLARIAGSMQLEPQEVARRAETIRAGYETQARELMGPWADQIIAYASQHDRAAALKAQDRHINHEDPAAYDGIASKFWQNLDKYNPDAILNAQNASAVGARRESNGTITVQTAAMNTRMSWGAAVRAGFIGKGR
jgi:hypothetical protein